MRVSKLYVYPIKSLRGRALKEAAVTKHGILYDRRFMLLKDCKGDSGAPDGLRYQNMHVADFTEMSLFLTDLKFPKDDFKGEVIVTYAPPAASSSKITIPLTPETQGLEGIAISMYSSETRAYQMGGEYSQWFSECFGFPVILAYLGENMRPVLFPTLTSKEPTPSTWLSSVIRGILGGEEEGEGEKITFADCAPYLVVSETSVAAVSALLPDGEDMDVTKFRPNIVLTGAPSPWEEDFWAEIAFTNAEHEQIRLITRHNCIRCQSLNIDFATGRPGIGKSGTVLKLLQKDRRVDKGKPYSPVFGRYSFLVGNGGVIKIGDEVEVTVRNKERTTFDWPTA